MERLRAVVALARDFDCWGLADGSIGLAKGTEALGRGGSGRNVMGME